MNPRSSSRVILSVEGSSLVLVLGELVRDPLEITAGVEDSLLVPKFVVIGSWFMRSDP